MLRRGYLDEMVKVLSDPRYGSSLAQVHATVKKHEAISADILARVSEDTDVNLLALEGKRGGELIDYKHGCNVFYGYAQNIVYVELRSRLMMSFRCSYLLFNSGFLTAIDISLMTMIDV